MLFLTNINDFVSIEPSTNIIICADDTSIYFPGSREDLPIIKATSFLNQLKSWTDITPYNQRCKNYESFV